jgi:DNA-binding NarL/FixJ family response regulator
MPRLYLVEDHTIVREGLRAVFEAAGFTIVGESDNITQALADLSQLVPDILVLDLGLGARSGLDLLAQLRGLGLPTQVLVLTTSDRPRDVAEAVRMGAAGYLLKGTSGSKVVQAIHEVLQGRRPSAEQDSGLFDVAQGERSSDPLALLSARERQIMRMVVGGQSSASIGSELNLSPKTIDTYRSRLMAKLGVHEVTGLVRLAVRTGIIDADPT